MEVETILFSSLGSITPTRGRIQQLQHLTFFEKSFYKKKDRSFLMDFQPSSPYDVYIYIDKEQRRGWDEGWNIHAHHPSRVRSAILSVKHDRSTDIFCWRKIAISSGLLGPSLWYHVYVYIKDRWKKGNFENRLEKFMKMKGTSGSNETRRVKSENLLIRIEILETPVVSPERG
ncbi:hypothetical protein KPH14_004654 [Odynerus spinipes]|uniref:Uncharacterized protein n=1 Tax=Odynerus spinipes TaxID=1348599 RepID=A0AAD9RM69_9HYME|nr:hypothetical protein KPH14_004654 [Odynerus spinipes]